MLIHLRALFMDTLPSADHWGHTAAVWTTVASPSHHREVMRQPGSPPASLHSKGHGDHTIRYLRRTCRIPGAVRARANRGEMQDVVLNFARVTLCFVSVLSWGPWKTVTWTSRCFWSSTLSWWWSPILQQCTCEWKREEKAFLPCSGNNKNKFSLSAHLWKIKCSLTADLQRRGTRQVPT